MNQLAEVAMSPIVAAVMDPILVDLQVAFYAAYQKLCEETNVQMSGLLPSEEAYSLALAVIHAVKNLREPAGWEEGEG